MIKQEPGSPLQRAVKQEAVKQEEQQGTGCFLADHGLLECLETYLDPQCFPGADFEIDLTPMDGDDSVTQAEVEELFAEEISSGLPAQQTGAHSNLARVDSAPFSSSSSCPSPGKADTAVLKREPLLQLLISDDSEAMPADVLPAAAAGSADPSTPTSVLQHTPAAPASMLHDSTEPNPSLTPASLPVAWQTAAPLAAAGAPQQQVLTNPLAQLAGPLARLAAARRASSGRAHTAGSGLAVPAPVQVPVGAFSNQAWAAVPATPVAVLAGGFSNLNPNLVQQLLTQQLLLAQLNAAQDSFLQMPPVTPTAAGEATHATAANPAQLGSFRRSSDNSDSPQVSRGLRRRSSSSDASQPSSSLGTQSRPMKRARTSKRATSLKPAQGAAAWLVGMQAPPPAIKVERSPAAFARAAPAHNSSAHAVDQSLPFCPVHGSPQPSLRKGVFRNTATGCWEARYKAGSAASMPGVLLGAFDTEAEAAHAYDIVALTVEGPRAAETNYGSECGGAGVGQLLGAGLHAVLRRVNTYKEIMAGYVPTLPGVFPSMALEGHWEARLYQGADYKYLGAFSNVYAAASTVQAAEQAVHNPMSG